MAERQRLVNSRKGLAHTLPLAEAKLDSDPRLLSQRELNMPNKLSSKPQMTPAFTATKVAQRDGFYNSPTDLPGDYQMSEIRGLRNAKLSKVYPRHSVLFNEGQESQGVYVLCEGRAKVSIASADGKTVVLRVARPGELLGINATLTGAPYSATVETLERCRIDFVPSEALLELLDRDKNACLDVAKALSRKLNGVVDHTRLLFLSRSASEKLARLLIRWCDDHGKRTAAGIRIDFRLTHEQVAEIICSSRETVTRVLTDLKRKQIVSYSDKAIFIRNRKALDSAARC